MKKSHRLKNGFVIASLMTAIFLAGSLTAFAETQASAPAAEPAKKCGVACFFDGIGKVLEKTYNNMTGKTTEPAKTA